MVATTVTGMAATATAQAPAQRKKYPSELGPRKRSEARAEAVMVRMPRLFRTLLQHAAEREGVSVNALILAELQPFFLRELESMNALDQMESRT